MSDRACGWVWHSAPNPITLGAIREVRTSLENDLAVLAAAMNQYVAVKDAQEHQSSCRANSAGSVLNVTVVDASSPGLWQMVKRHKQIFLSETASYCHKNLFTSDRLYIVPKHLDWAACIPQHPKQSNTTSMSTVVKAKLATKAMVWGSFGVVLRRFPKLSGFVICIGCLYLIKLTGNTPAQVVFKAGNLVFDVALDLLGVEPRTFSLNDYWWIYSALFTAT